MLQESLNEAHTGIFREFKDVFQSITALFEIWPQEDKSDQIGESGLEAPADSNAPLFSRGSQEKQTGEPLGLPTWTIAFTPTFQRSIMNIDKTLQGRILLALIEISREPVSIVGDTKKPLTGTLKGLWRYRLGDHRLIYQPDKTSLTVILLQFSPRSSSYE